MHAIVPVRSNAAGELMVTDDVLDEYLMTDRIKLSTAAAAAGNDDSSR